MLGKRLISAAVLIPIVAAAVYLGGYVLLILALAAILLAGYEYQRLLCSQRLRPPLFFLVLIIILFICDSPPLNLSVLAWGLPLVTLLALTAEIRRANAPGSLSSWALAVAGGIYLGFPVNALLHLRAMDQGMYWILLALLGTWLCDTAAYFVGVRWGKRKFYPAISPKKTLEGALAGIAVGIIVVMFAGIFVMHLAWWWAAIAGVLIVLGSTYGDLAESIIKRQCCAKDSSNLIPGHGGMLDRIDSLLYVFPLVYLTASCMQWLAG